MPYVGSGYVYGRGVQQGVVCSSTLMESIMLVCQRLYDPGCTAQRAVCGGTFLLGNANAMVSTQAQNASSPERCGLLDLKVGLKLYVAVWPHLAATVMCLLVGLVVW